MKTGWVINGYELKQLLGKGGMAEVYYAETRFGKGAAIKLLQDDFVSNHEMNQRFIREAETVAKLKHRNVCEVFDAGEYNGHSFIILEYLKGEDLGDYIKANGKPSEKEALQWMRQALEGLQEAHQHDIIHRDIKPANLFLTSDGLVKVVDFGIAKVKEAGTGLTATNVTVGTLTYMSPEQISQPKLVNYLTDIYSMGVTLHTLLKGTASYDSDDDDSDFKIMNWIVREPLTALADASPPVNEFIQKATDKDRGKRYQNCAEMIADLDVLLNKKPVVVAKEYLQTKIVEVPESITNKKHVSLNPITVAPRGTLEAKEEKNKLFDLLQGRKWLFFTVFIFIQVFASTAIRITAIVHYNWEDILYGIANLFMLGFYFNLPDNWAMVRFMGFLIIPISYFAFGISIRDKNTILRLIVCLVVISLYAWGFNYIWKLPDQFMPVFTILPFIINWSQVIILTHGRIFYAYWIKSMAIQLGVTVCLGLLFYFFVKVTNLYQVGYITDFIYGGVSAALAYHFVFKPKANLVLNEKGSALGKEQLIPQLDKQTNAKFLLSALIITAVTVIVGFSGWQLMNHNTINTSDIEPTDEANDEYATFAIDSTAYSAVTDTEGVVLIGK